MGIERLRLDALEVSFGTACDYLEVNREILDNLNVYPVPDGDTGVNMLSTLKPAVDELKKTPCNSLADMAKIMNTMLAKNSRGNSGFILAQFFRGFWEAVGTPEDDYIDSNDLVRGFEKGSFLAVSSLLSPVEGTMITIISSMLEAMKSLQDKNIVEYFEIALTAGRESLFRTPEQLPLLAEAGVIDAGALGFILVIKGMLCGIKHSKVEIENENDYRFEPKPAGASGAAGPANRTRPPEFRYCVELDLETMLAATDAAAVFADYLKQNGGSIALIADGSRLRVHIHTNIPENIIETSSKYGSLLHSKIDDMEEQIESLKQADIGERVTSSVLSIIPGPGFRKLFEELGAADCYECSTSLPSVDDLLKSVERMENDDIIVLANNANNIPTVQLLGEQTQKRVYVLRTGSVVDGITAMYGYVDSSPAGENISSMKDCIGLAETLNIYRSTRDAQFGQIQIPNGDHFVVKDGELLSTSANLYDSAMAAAKKIDTMGKSNVSFYYGKDLDLCELEKLKKGILALNTALEFEQHYGGQEQSVLIVAFE
jgi:uncharacterized protein